MKFTMTLLSLLIITVLGVSGVRADQHEMIGQWVNIDPNTRTIPKLVISESDGQWKIQVWGRCHPDNCDWGETDLQLIGTSIADRVFERGLAVWDHGFASSYVQIKFEKDELVVECVTVFKDNSGRSNYRQVNRLRRPKEAS